MPKTKQIDSGFAFCVSGFGIVWIKELCLGFHFDESGNDIKIESWNYVLRILIELKLLNASPNPRFIQSVTPILQWWHKLRKLIAIWIQQSNSLIQSVA